MPIHRVSRGRDETATASRTTNRRRQRGQTLVEFALVIPLFMGILIAIVEFAFTFNAVLARSTRAATPRSWPPRPGTPTAPTAPSCARSRPTWARRPTRATSRSVEVYQASAAGDQIGAATVYARGGAFNCTMPDGTSITLPLHPDPGRLPRGRAMQRPRRLRRPRARPRRRQGHLPLPVEDADRARVQPVPRRDAIQLDAHGARAVIRRATSGGAARPAMASAARAWSSSR